MFGGTQSQPQQPPQLNQPAPATEAEEEALKKNTDCVYFLASPLTCKKGSECEYRHSDIARVNPRDCWFWLNSHCLNPKCAFRHPPLDGLMGIQVPASVGPSLASPQSAAAPVVHGHNSGKQGVPCVFFQKGFCLKGDRCPFLHAPFSANKAGSTVVAAPVNEPPTLTKAFGGLEKPEQVQKVPQINVPKPVNPPPQGKPAIRFDTGFSRNGVSIDKHVPPSGLNDEPLRYRPTNIPPATQGDSINRSNRVLQAHVSEGNSTPNAKDVDEFSREPSPGFDVLVDDDLRDSDYYSNEDQFGRARGHDGRNLNPLNDYDIGRSADYNSMVDVDRELYHDYDSFELLQGQYGWEDHRLSSERMLGGSSHLERRRYPRTDSPDRVEESDLRNLLAKQRRGGNGLRSVISRDRDNRGEDRNYRAPRRDTHHLPPQESSVSSRLRGRIKMPGRSTSPVNDHYSHSEREIEKGRNRGRFSPERPPITSHQGRLRDRIKVRAPDDFNNEGRNLLGSRMRRDAIINENNSTEFHGPRRLLELKVDKNNAESSDRQQVSDRQSLGKRKFPNQQSDGNLSFEGPKPLSEILKRKRGSEAAVPERKENLLRSTVTSETRGVISSLSKSASVEPGSADQGPTPEKVKPIEGQSSLQHNASDLGDEEGLITDEPIEEDHEAVAYDDQRGGEYEDDQVDEEDYNVDGGENAADLEEEYLDDDDEDADDADDFAKKMGVMYS
ncbi:hypothetical protein LguiB_025352 [Lonicera macranthoides]